MQDPENPKFLPLKTTTSVDPYADWHPERAAYAQIGREMLNEIALLEAHVGGPLTVQRLNMLAAMKGVTPPDGGYAYEAAAIRKLKAAPTRGCPPHIRNRLSVQLQLVWPDDLPRPPNPDRVIP